MSFREKDRVMSFLFRYYPTEKEMRYLPFDELPEYKVKFMNQADEILDRMPINQRKILESDYILREDPGWWIADLSKSQYYRLKGAAMTHFLAQIEKQ